MSLFAQLANALFWVGVVGGGLAFLAWVGDRLHARDVEDPAPDTVD